MPALLFGSISTLADTSELQREAFNRAFAEHGLDWNWDRPAYQKMLDSAGGQNRVAAYAADRGEDVDAAAVHQSKSAIFQQLLADSELEPRAGVAEAIADARSGGFKTGFVTTTSADNVSALLGALSASSPALEFDVVLDSSDVDQPKPDQAAYLAALESLQEKPADCVAVEDNTDGVTAAESAGLTCVAFPNQNTAGHDFGGARVIDRVDFDELAALVRG